MTTIEATKTSCGDWGGRTDGGKPCRMPAGWGTDGEDGRCRKHREHAAGPAAVLADQDRADDLGWLGMPAANFVNPGVAFRTHPFKRRTDKVAIVGFTDHRDQALRLDPDEWEIWGLNELYRYMPVERFDRWFEVHDRAYLASDEDGRKHLEDLKGLDIPVYMQKCWGDIGPSVYFPARELTEVLGAEYFTNCPAWMIGLAIAMGYKAIHVYGVDMANDSELAYQRPCCEWWLGVARGMGIEIAVPPTSDLLKTFGLYGYKDVGHELAQKMQEREEYLHRQDNDKLGLIRELEFQYKFQKPDLLAQVHSAEGRLMEARERCPDDTERHVELEAAVRSARVRLARLEDEYETKREALLAQRHQIFGGIADVGYWKTRWLVKADGTEGPLPDRSKDPRTGISTAEAIVASAPSADGKGA